VEPVAIIGVGQNVHARRRDDVAYAELVLEAIQQALDDAGVGLGEIENAVTACLDFYDGRTIANMATAEVVGSYLGSESRICGDGITALVYGWSRIADGEFELGLITAHCKESEGNLHDIEAAAFDPFYQRRLDADGDVVAGLYARHLYETGAVDPDAAAEVVVRARRAAALNPAVEGIETVTSADVAGSPIIADPLRALDKAPRSDGSCALVVAAGPLAERLSEHPVWITGTGAITGGFWSDREPDDLSALTAAADRARSAAGWNGAPPDVVELSAQFGFQAVQFADALGVDIATDACNPSGGWHAGNPITVTGMARVVEAVTQLRGAAGQRQMDGARRALAHGVTGLGAQAHSVVALEAG
jgi:acetyl-CoA acetyltransferase